MQAISSSLQNAEDILRESEVTFTTARPSWQDTSIRPVVIENNVLTVPYGHPYVAFLCVAKRTEVGVPYTACETRAALGEPVAVAPWFIAGLAVGLFIGWVLVTFGSSKKGPAR